MIFVFGLLGTEVAARKKLSEEEKRHEKKSANADGSRKRKRPPRYDSDTDESVTSEESQQPAHDLVRSFRCIQWC